MGRDNAPTYSGKLVQLILPGRRSQALVRTNDDWQALGVAASRMLFWCGGFIHGCRCETNEIHFAVQVAHTSIGAIAQHIAGAYGKHLRQRRGWRGAVFKHYRVTPFDGEVYLDDLVMWLHRPAEPRPRGKLSVPVWTGESAYLSPRSLPWVTTDRVLQELSIGAPNPAAYLRRKTQPIASEVIEVLTSRHPTRRQRKAIAPNSHDSERGNNGRRPSVDAIARTVAEYSNVGFDAMRSRSRKRALSKAKAIATVLCTRNGATVAAVARLFNRSRSTLIEQAEYYRQIQPQIFAEAESALATLLDRTRP
jgi:Bacterial dnaA protein helix-turn-helix